MSQASDRVAQSSAALSTSVDTLITKLNAPSPVPSNSDDAQLTLVANQLDATKAKVDALAALFPDPAPAADGGTPPAPAV